MDWKAQIGLGLAILAIVGIACFFWGRNSVSVETYEVVRTEIKWLPAVELNYVGQASLSDIQFKSIPIHITRSLDTNKSPVNGLVRVAEFDSLYNDSTRISIDYYYPPLNLFDVNYSYPRNETIKYVNQTKVITKYNWFNHGLIAGVGYSPFSKRFDGYFGYGVMISIHNLFR